MRVAQIALLAHVCACGGTAQSPDAGPTSTVQYTHSRNAFIIQDSPSASGWASVKGRVYEAPLADWYTASDSEGVCTLLVYADDDCDPICDFGEFCIEGSCTTLPEAYSLGEITLSGIRDEPLELEPPFGGVYTWGAEGAIVDSSVRLGTVAQGPFAATNMSANVPGKIAPASDWDDLMADRNAGEDVVLTWSDPDSSARIYLRMTTGIGTHGGISPVEIECEAADTGELTLPGSFLDELYAEGWSCGECGSNDLFRYHAAAQDVGAPDDITLIVSVATSFYFHP